jgi:peptidyl-Lys metalloendopeptidase
MRFPFWRRFAAFLALSLCAPAGFADVAVELAMDSGAFKTSEEVRVLLTLQNRGPEPVSILKWHTPEQDLEEDLFLILHDGVEVPYQGPHFKRAAPIEEDFVRLAAGETVSGWIELSSAYALSASGNYRLQYRVEGMDLEDPVNARGVDAAASDSRLKRLESGWVDFTISGDRQASAISPDPYTAAGEGIGFQSCSNSEQADLSDAVDAAREMVAGVRGYFGSGRNASRYAAWFGTYAPDRYDLAADHFDAIADALDNRRLDFDCTCTGRHFAYVFTQQPYTVYLCQAFWAAPLTGTDSRGGTLIHELSHFDVVVGTDDHAYGQTAARALAKTSPPSALNNADNHEYFGENAPPLD